VNGSSKGEPSAGKRQIIILLPTGHLHRTKKQLLYLAVCDPDLQVTGATVRIGAFVKYLARYYDVTLVNMEGSGYRVDPEIAKRFQDHDNQLGVTQRVSIEFSQPGYFLFSTALYRAVDSFLKTGMFDYLVADYGLAALYGSWFAKRYGIPLVYCSHNIEYRMYRRLSRYDWRRALLVPYVYLAERAACHTATLLVVISENDGRHYAKWVGTDKIKVIPQGFDPDVYHPFYPPPPSSPAVVLFVGSFRSEPNRQAARHVVRDILPTVVKERPDVIFQFVGADPPNDLTGPNVECCGFVDDLAPYLRRANVVLAPMPFAHGMATKIIHALAFGKPMVSTPEAAGAIPQKYRQLVVAPMDAFASAIVELLSGSAPMGADEFEDLCSLYAWPRLIARLSQRIEQSCSA
jgi:glycosyltransferase involved in cell wall biosynthesis